MEYFSEIINTTLASFDFAYCIIVNILTYIVIKIITEARNKDIKTWVKRVILLICILLTGVVLTIKKLIRIWLNKLIVTMLVKHSCRFQICL